MPPTSILTGATADQLVQAVAANHRELFRQEARSLGGSVSESAGLCWTSGTPRSTSMIAFPELSQETAGHQLDEIMDYYVRHPPGGAGCWSLDPPQPPDLGIRLLARGFQPGWRPHWMALDLSRMRAGQQSPAGLRIVRDNEIQLLSVRDLPYAQVVMPIPSQTEFPGQWVRFVASIKKRVVGQSVVFLTTGARGVAGIYHVGVIPQERNKGIGKAVTLMACQYAIDQGYRYAVLNSTDAGRKPYGQLGFEAIGDGWTWWLVTERLLAQPPDSSTVRLAEAVGRADEAGLAVSRRENPSRNLNGLLTNGMTLMQLAVHCRQTRSAEWLIEGGAEYTVLDAWDLGWKDRAAQLLRSDRQRIHQLYGKEEKSLLHVAAERNDEALAELALAAGPDLYWRDNTWKATPLEWANYFGYANIARMIRERR